MILRAVYSDFKAVCNNNCCHRHHQNQTGRIRRVALATRCQCAKRLLKDELDISEFFKSYQKFGISDAFEKIDTKRIYTFAEKFGQIGLIEKYIAPEGSSI